MKCVSYIFFSLFLCFTSMHVIAKQHIELFNEANKLYMNQSYEKAAEAYEQLIADNYISPEIYFNLGNSYYKSGNIASAILNYERAKKLRPSDPDIAYNLRMANLNTIDKIEPLPQLFYEKWWEDFVNNGSVTFRAYWVIGLFWFSLLIFAVYLFSRSVAIRKLAFFATIMALLVAGFMWYLTWLQQHHLNDNRAAIIFAESTYAKSSPDEKSSNLFLLHSGTRIEVLDELQGWRKIRIANGNEGWIIKDAVEII